MANVLLVDDDQAILDIVGLWLENEGHTVVKAHDGEIALSSLDDKKFDVMITDIIMPKTEGIELIREIRRKRKKMGIVAISAGGKHGANYLNAAKSMGANTVISKPLEQEIIVSAVADLLH